MSGNRYSWREMLAALRHRKSAAMFVLGFASGLPYVLITGTLYAWFAKADVGVATIGVFSWIVILYSFKFIWSPAVDRAPVPRRLGFGQRRAYILLFQAVITAALFVVATSEPSSQLLLIGGAAVVCTLASTCQDVLIDAWRIEVGDKHITVDLLSAVYQLGYRLTSVLAGAGALIMAARLGWNETFLILTVLMVVAVSGVLIAIDSAPQRKDVTSDLELPPRWRNFALTPVLLGWAWAFVAIFGFMAYALAAPKKADASAFTEQVGPYIILAAIVVPVGIAAIMLYVHRHATAPTAVPRRKALQHALDTLYGSILAPMIDLIERLRFGALLVLVVILSYRFTDLVWGAFAYPFYLGHEHGALGHTLDEVAIASKMFGVLMTFIGIGVGAAAIVRVGRMPALFVGAVLAAATNLLYADLALGAPVTNAVLTTLHLYPVFSVIQPVVDFLHLNVTVDHSLAQLMIVIAAENLAVGFAGAAFVAYLSDIASKRYAAVQYALLVSLAFLLGSLGRGALGEMIAQSGYAHVFIFTAILGSVAVVACALEWVRQSFAANTDR